MLDIINLYLYEEFIKRQEKIPVIGWNDKVPSRLNKFTTRKGTLQSHVLGGREVKNRILVI